MTPNHARAARLRERIEERLSRSPSEHAYPVEDWQIVERRFVPEYLPALESVFAVANGYLGLRGTPEEGYPVHEGGAVLNGFHETWPIVYPEDAFGLARTGQTIVGATDGSVIYPQLTSIETRFDADIVTEATKRATAATACSHTFGRPVASIAQPPMSPSRSSKSSLPTSCRRSSRASISPLGPWSCWAEATSGPCAGSWSSSVRTCWENSTCSSYSD